MKTLITGGKSATAIKLVKAFELHEVILADYGDVPAIASSTYRFISLGARNEDSIAHLLLNHCLDHQVDHLLPLHLFEIEPLVKSEILFREFNVNILLPPLVSYHSFIGKPASTKDWAVFDRGELLFSTLYSTQLVQYGLSNVLSGAFDVGLAGEELKLNLISI